MKKTITVVMLSILPLVSFGQVIDDFETAPADTNYWIWYNPVMEGSGATGPGGHYAISTNADPTLGFVNTTYVTDPANGAGSVQFEYAAQNAEGWGGYSKITHLHPDSGGVYNWSQYDSLSFSYYVVASASEAGRVHLRFNLRDYGDVVDDVGDLGEYYYSFHYILDMTAGWHTIDIPLIAGDFWGGEGFNHTGWAGTPGNLELDTDRIKGFDIEFSVSGGGEGDVITGTVVLDDLMLKGPQPLDLIFFNGYAIPGNMSLYGGWSGTVTTTDEEAYTTGSNSLKWENGGQWDGPVWTINESVDLSFGGTWESDTLKFKIMAPDGTPELRIRFSDTNTGDGTDGGDFPLEAHFILTPDAVGGYDGTWKEVGIALADFNRWAGFWNNDHGHNEDGEMDITAVNQFAIIATSGGLAGPVYLDEIWVGSPYFDVVAPTAPENVSGTPASYYNLVTWTDVPGEDGESYDVFASLEPITDLGSGAVDIVALDILEGTQAAVHYLYAPNDDANVTYYYAVVCADAAGNESGIGGGSSASTNTALGIPTIVTVAPTGFAADGDLSEWYDSEIEPFELGVSDNSFGTPHVIGSVTDDNDLFGTIFIAMDNDFLYVAGDVIDNNYTGYTGEGNWWELDAFELFIGLYDQQGPKHAALSRGAEPDYKFVFYEAGLVNDLNSAQVMATSGDGNYYFEGFNPDYVFEAKISLDSILIGDDARYNPIAGDRIPVEPTLHDNDGSGWEGNLVMSPSNNDNAWQTPSVWSYTFITVGTVGIDDDVSIPLEFALHPNFPNPFNPVTKIQFTTPNAGQVKLSIYNMLGAQVGELVNKDLPMGHHEIVWNANQMASGVYFYKLEAGTKVQTRKMILLK
ncbi:MAG: T9SS type A sorting domain-containing protein [Candidatus Marinimicrobia bacterium]|nr:T9SS type A sorting domain-containing protein [Candidatus Neomarinimicrobiota bacterium]